MEVVLSDSFHVLSLLLYAKPSYIDKSYSHSAVGNNYCDVGCPLLDPCLLNPYLVRNLWEAVT